MTVDITMTHEEQENIELSMGSPERRKEYLAEHGLTSKSSDSFPYSDKARVITGRSKELILKKIEYPFG